ncbi:putative disease resistance protein RGA4 isoform X1 [Typha angustifolia]|uniref:putative disease resistance protein RGA4 isoform X1 n=2 Tax=Typha angustifolia TaxID=59011 RepID=UPI003C2DFABB
MGSTLSTLGSCAAGELTQHFSLKDDIRRLRTTLPKVRVLIDKAECWTWKHEDLPELLRELRNAAYDADNLLDDFDYHELQHKIEGGESQASQLLYSSLNSARNIINRAPNNVRDLQGRLDHLAAQMETLFRLLPLDDESKQYGMSAVRRETTSFLTEPEVFGRDDEREKVIKLLLKSGDGSGSGNSGFGGDGVTVPPTKRRKTENESVLPLVGIGGVGKTTLAQLVYNDQRVDDHFEPKMWVCVSDYFDVTRITTEMLGKQSDTRNLNDLQMILKAKVMSMRFLLVLDDVWNEESEEWKRLIAPLRSGLRGSMILVTTRSQKVADITGTMEPIFLKGLPDDAYWECFKRFAFGFENPKDHPELEAIGKKIAAKLNGSPLAAKTLGGLLCSEMEASRWRTILKSKMWELPQKENDILPALRLSYQYLPPHLKRCFSICSMFRKDHMLNSDVLIKLWLAQGYILPQGDMVLEDIGTSYFNDLVSRSFLQLCHGVYGLCVMHDLIHDLSQFISQSECFSMQVENFQQEAVTTTRHLTVYTETLEPSKLMEIGNFNKLQSLVFPVSFEPDLGPTISFLFNRLTNIRYLKLSDCKIKELPESIGNLKHLRHLDISSTDIARLPEALCRLYNLLVLKLSGCPITCFPQGFSNLINLRTLILPYRMTFSKIAKIGKLTSLQYLGNFEVLKQHGHVNIEELKDMNQLRGSLSVEKLENVEKKEDARQAKLNNKEHLNELELQWSNCRDSSKSESKNSDLDVEGVLDGLQPHPNLKRLQIQGYRGAKLSQWVQTQMLPCLTSLGVRDCPQLMEIASFTSLSSLDIVNCPNIKVPFLPPASDLKLINVRRVALPRQELINSSTSIIKSSSLTKLPTGQCVNLTTTAEECLMPHSCLHPTNKSIYIWDCEQLVSLPVERFKDFISLEDLQIRNCPKLTCPREMLLPTSIKSLMLDSCGDLDKSLPNCLCNLTALTYLTISRCPHVTSLPSQVLCHLRALSKLVILDCEGMESLNGIQVLRSLEYLDIRNCPKVIESDPLMPDDEVHMSFEGQPSLERLTIDNTAILKLSFLTSLSPLLKRLTICDSQQQVMFSGEGHECLQSLKSLNSLQFDRCLNLRSLPAELHSMTSLECLDIYSCPEIQSLPEKGLPTSLTSLHFNSCHPMLTEQLEKHKSLMKTKIV